MATLTEGSWGHTPRGCFIHAKADYAAISPHFSDGVRANDGRYQLVCEQGGQLPGTGEAGASSVVAASIRNNGDVDSGRHNGDDDDDHHHMDSGRRSSADHQAPLFIVLATTLCVGILACL